MKMEQMKVKYQEGEQNGMDRLDSFSIDEPAPELEVKGTGMFIKIGICMVALALALVVRLFGVEGERTAEPAMQTNEAEPSQAVGALRYVEADTKWQAPVLSNDVELLRDNQLLRFTATEPVVRSCMAGRVLMVETDARFGTFVRIQGEDGWESVLYGFETVSVENGQSVETTTELGTVSVGGSIYLSIQKDGVPGDPAEWIDLSLAS